MFFSSHVQLYGCRYGLGRKLGLPSTGVYQLHITEGQRGKVIEGICKRVKIMRGENGKARFCLQMKYAFILVHSE